MIDEHLAELQLLNSAVVINDRGRMNGSSENGGVSSTTKVNGHSSAAVAAPAETEKEKVERRKKPGGRRGLSGDFDQLIKVKKHHRRPSDIDSLSPEVLRALQSTFGGKLDEIRSKLQPRARSPPSAPPSPPPLQVPTPVPTPPPSPPRPPAPAAAVEKEQHTFVERLADREGAYMLIAYFSAIFLSGFILLATEEDDSDGDIDGQDELCGGLGVVESRCARQFGFILPTVLTAIFFTLAFIFFVFDVSYSLFNILTAAKGFFSETKKENTPTLVSGKKRDDVRGGRPRLSAAGLVLPFVIDVGFIVASSALLWMAKTSTVDPVRTICDQRLQLIWILGLMAMEVVILFSAIKSFRDPRISNVCIQTAAKRVSVILCVLLACSAAYNHAVPETKELIICAPRIPAEKTFKGIQMYEPSQLCGPMTKNPGKEGPKLLQCLWWPLSRNKGRHQDWCEANEQCDWPRAKRIQVYERKDVCSVGFPQCDWPLLKQIQAYEDKDRCQPQKLVQCEWPLLKQVQLYEHEERCQPKDYSLQQCEWPWLKRIKLFEGLDRCPPMNSDACEWPLLKQLQLSESDDSFPSQRICRCRQRRT